MSSVFCRMKDPGQKSTPAVLFCFICLVFSARISASCLDLDNALLQTACFNFLNATKSSFAFNKAVAVPKNISTLNIQEKDSGTLYVLDEGMYELGQIAVLDSRNIAITGVGQGIDGDNHYTELQVVPGERQEQGFIRLRSTNLVHIANLKVNAAKTSDQQFNSIKRIIITLLVHHFKLSNVTLHDLNHDGGSYLHVRYGTHLDLDRIHLTSNLGDSSGSYSLIYAYKVKRSRISNSNLTDYTFNGDALKFVDPQTVEFKNTDVYVSPHANFFGTLLMKFEFTTQVNNVFIALKQLAIKGVENVKQSVEFWAFIHGYGAGEKTSGQVHISNSDYDRSRIRWYNNLDNFTINDSDLNSGSPATSESTPISSSTAPVTHLWITPTSAEDSLFDSTSASEAVIVTVDSTPEPVSSSETAMALLSSPPATHYNVSQGRQEESSASSPSWLQPVVITVSTVLGALVATSVGFAVKKIYSRRAFPIGPTNIPLVEESL